MCIYVWNTFFVDFFSFLEGLEANKHGSFQFLHINVVVLIWHFERKKLSDFSKNKKGGEDSKNKGTKIAFLILFTLIYPQR